MCSQSPISSKSHISKMHLREKKTLRELPKVFAMMGVCCIRNKDENTGKYYYENPSDNERWDDLPLIVGGVRWELKHTLSGEKFWKSEFDEISTVEPLSDTETALEESDQINSGKLHSSLECWKSPSWSKKRISAKVLSRFCRRYCGSSKRGDFTLKK